jgi:glucosamine--fructose-6-phosphate aminotransferase (isomerizing)
MCGIVGYLGTDQATPILLQGLRRLEYRGYDSAGIAVQNGTGLEVRKSAGKIANLERLLSEEPMFGTTGIAHTRWATHGAPNQTNAHPHTNHNGDIALVHNGIIENYDVLREKLLELGHTFRTETDSEVLIHLVSECFEGNLEQSVAAALTQVEGTFGIAVISATDPEKIVVARRSAPLLVGLGENGDDSIWVASDVSAILGHTRRVIDLDDDEIGVLSNGSYETIDLKQIYGSEDWTPIDKEISHVDWNLESIERAGYPHFMLKEIHEQPDTVQNATRGRLLEEEGTARLGGLDQIADEIATAERIILIGCGTSWHAALVGEYIIEEMARLPTEVEYASEFRYRNPVILPNTLVGGISQSGETADTLAAIREAKRLDASTFGVVNVVGSTIARETDAGVYTHAGPEIGVASTKAFVAQVTALALFGLMLARRRGMSLQEGRKIIRAIQELPQLMDEVLNTAPHIRDIAQKFGEASNFLYLGRGPNFPIALEGALKLKEISYIHAEGYPAAEMKHGPIALIDDDMPVVFVAPQDSVYKKVVLNIDEVKTRGGRVIALVTNGDESLNNKVEHLIRVPKTLPLLQPILNLVPLQLLAYYIAVLRGCDVDQPRNLAKSVTVE